MIGAWTVFSDGGSRGNPGPAAAAYVIRDEAGRVVREKSFTLGSATNNVAEYCALIEALNEASRLGAHHVDCFLDSELVVRQLNGVYRIKEEKMRRLFREITHLTRSFKKISFSHVPREKNRRADSLVNQALDTQTGS